MGVPPSTTAPRRTGARREPDHTGVRGLPVLPGLGDPVSDRFLPAEGLTLAHGSVAALCLTCLTATSPREEQPQPEAHSPATGENVPTARRWIGPQPAPR